MLASNRGKFIDRSPEISSAGQLYCSGDLARDCLVSPNGLTTKEKAKSPDISSQLTHGKNTKPSILAGELINPKPKSFFQERVQNKREGDVYASKKNAPLGCSHDQKPGLPIDVTPYEPYGVPTLQDMSGHIGGDLVNPPKSWCDVLSESVQGSELYKKSHNQYDVGEPRNRGYNWSRVPDWCRFGIQTPHENSGINTQDTLLWGAETVPQLLSKRVDDFRERTTAQVGQVHAPINGTVDINTDRTFGITAKADEYSAGDLIHSANQTNEFKTTYSEIDNVLIKSVPNEQKPCGVLSVRSDLPAPRIRRMGDTVNYGDESDAYGLIQPSVYSQRGVYEEDFFKARDQKDIKRIFDSAGVELSHDMFLKLWSKATEGHKDGSVSVERFRNILDQNLEQCMVEENNANALEEGACA